jgi:DNA-binding transcriptional MerR regulator
MSRCRFVLMSGRWKLEELAERAGVSPRTIRYYVQRGLLPAPEFRGKDSSYGEMHLARLRAIRLLQQRYLPLDAISAELEGRTVEQLRELAKSGAAEAPGPSREQAASRPGEAATQQRWRRLELAPGIELHLREDRTDEPNAWLEEIVSFIRQRASRR